MRKLICITALAAVVVTAFAAPASAAPRMTKTQAVGAAEKYMKRSSDFKTKSITCLRIARGSFTCKVQAKYKPTGVGCSGFLRIIVHLGKVKAVGDKAHYRDPNSCTRVASGQLPPPAPALPVVGG